EAARKEAHAALELDPSPEAYLVLGRLDLAAGKLDDARKNLDDAIKLDPKSKPARELKEKLDASKEQKK
ncbi:MAG: tetratricopeptide repeat protein, partial [Terracidiphilus sp.]